MTAQPTGHLAVTRTAEFDLSAEELWDLVSDGRRWSEWMVDQSDVEVTPGGTGIVIDDGVARRVTVRTVSDRRVAFEWGPVDLDAAEGTVVELEVTPTDDGRSRLRVVESSASAGAGFAWDLRLLSLCSCVAMCCRT